MSEITDIVQEIRDYINESRKQTFLLRDSFFWNQLCSSLDIVEDTDLAIEEYLKINEVNTDGMKYLFVFGIMQVLFVQQDAIINMAESLGAKFELDTELKSIREIRNNSIGHPTKRSKGLNSKYNFIIRAYLTHKNLSLMTISPNEENDTKFCHYNIDDLIISQRKSVNKLLKELIKMLENEDKVHMEQFKNVKLYNVFPVTINYHFQKITDLSCIKTFIKGNFEIIKKALEDFKEELKRRDCLEAYDGVNFIFENLIYPMNKLDKYFRNEIELDKEEVRIYKFFIKKQFDELMDMAKEIDKEYEENV